MTAPRGPRDQASCRRQAPQPPSGGWLPLTQASRHSPHITTLPPSTAGAPRALPSSSGSSSLTHLPFPVHNTCAPALISPRVPAPQRSSARPLHSHTSVALAHARQLHPRPRPLRALICAHAVSYVRKVLPAYWHKKSALGKREGYALHSARFVSCRYNGLKKGVQRYFQSPLLNQN